MKNKALLFRLFLLLMSFFPKYSQTPPCIIFNAIYKKVAKVHVVLFSHEFRSLDVPSFLPNNILGGILASRNRK